METPVPRELMEWIFSFLDGKDICRGRMVCKLWDEALRLASPSLWHRVLEDSLGARDKPHHIKEYRDMSLCQYFIEVMQTYRALMTERKYEEVVRFASSHGHLQILKNLAKLNVQVRVFDGFDSITGRNDTQLPPVALAAIGGHVEVIKWLASVKVRFNRGICRRWPNPIHFAASLGNKDVIQELSRNGSSAWGILPGGVGWPEWINSSRIRHHMELPAIAARYGHTDCIAPDNNQLPSVIAEINRRASSGLYILHQALLGGHIQTFDWIMSQEGISFKESVEPSFLAAGVLSHRIHVVEHLLDKGYRPKPNGCELHIAANAGCLNILKLLLKHIPPSEKALEWTDEDGRTPLMAALMKGRMHKPTIEYLIDEGSNINATDNRGRSVLWYLWQCPFKNSQKCIPSLQRKLLDGGVDLQWRYEGRGCLTNLFRTLNRFPLIAEQLSNMLIEGGVPLDDPELIPIASAYRWPLESFQNFLDRLEKSNKDLFLKDPPDLIRRCAANGVRTGRLQEIIKRLHEFGVTEDLFAPSPLSGETPFSCCTTHYSQTLRELIAVGGDINLRNGKGQHFFVSHLLSWLPRPHYRNLATAEAILSWRVHQYRNLGAILNSDDVAACDSLLKAQGTSSHWSAYEHETLMKQIRRMLPET